MFQGGKNCKNRYKVYYWRHSTRYGRAHREAVYYLRQKLGRNTHPERCVCPEWGTQKRGDLNHLHSSSGSLFESESHSVVFNSVRPHGLFSPWNSPGQNTGVDSRSLLQGFFPTQGSNPGLLLFLYQLIYQGSPGLCLPWPVVSFLFPHLTCSRTLPNMHVQHFAKMESIIAEACGCKPTLLTGWCPLPFDPEVTFLHVCRQGSFPWPQEWSSYLCFCRAQFLPLALSLECLGENKASVLIHLTNTSCPTQEPSISYLTNFHCTFFDTWPPAACGFRLRHRWIKMKRSCLWKVRSPSGGREHTPQALWAP